MKESSVTVSGSKEKRKKKYMSLSKKESIAGYFFAAPAILGLLIWTIGPLIASLLLSFTDWTALSTPNWVGLENFKEILPMTFSLKSHWLLLYTLRLGVHFLRYLRH